VKERGKRGLAGLVLNQWIGSAMCGIETMAEKEGGGGAHIYERNSKKAGTPSLIKEGHLVSWIFPYFVTFFFFFSSVFFPFPLEKCVNVTNVHHPGGGGGGEGEKGSGG